MSMNKNECDYETKHCQGIRFSYNHQEWSESKESREDLWPYFCNGMQSNCEYLSRCIPLYPLYTEKGEAVPQL